MGSIRPTVYLVLTTMLVMLTLTACGQAYTFRGVELQPTKPAPELALTDQNGQPFRLSSQKGNVVLLFFGFTSCPDVCPTTLADHTQALEKLGKDAAQVQVVLVSVDPERDTPAKLKTYLARYNPAYVGLTGTPAQLDAVYQAYGVTAIKRDLKNSALDYTMDHSASTYVIDKQGQWRLMLPFGSAVEDVVNDLRELVRS